MNRIRAARQAMGWTQNDLAAKAGVSARTIHAIEKGRPCRQATKRKIHRSRRREAPERTRVRGRD
jgi:DNA-binding XRE family transcriptional regulator